MRKASLILSLCLAFGRPLTVAQTPWQSERRRTRSDVLGVDERSHERLVRLYSESHALVIGMSEYADPGWADLSGVTSDVKEVSAALSEHGFLVESVMNLRGPELLARMEAFIEQYGADEQGRLLIYYAGHGYKTTSGGREEGYIVPSDAPLPDEKAPAAFAAKAIDMRRIMALVSKIKSKHALLVLDSCFSGSLINAAQALPEAASPSAVGLGPTTPERAGQTADGMSPHPPHPHPIPVIPFAISTDAEEQAHLFITSGTDKQLADDDSEFRRKFVQALTDESGAGADMNGDSYVTGEELWNYLYNNVTENLRGRQRPRRGYIGSQAANPGDFVFVLPGAYAKEEMVGPAVEPELWDVPTGWRFVKEKGTDRLLAEGHGIALPKDLVAHSFHDLSFVTRLRLTNNTAAGFVLRAQGPQDYYLIRITGNNARRKEDRFRIQAFAVRGGMKSELAGSPLNINHPDVEGRLNAEGLIQVTIEAKGNEFKVEISATEGNGRGFELIAPIRFVDEEQTFRYGAAGYLVDGEERFKIEGISVAKLRKKGQV